MKDNRIFAVVLTLLFVFGAGSLPQSEAAEPTIEVIFKHTDAIGVVTESTYDIGDPARVINGLTKAGKACQLRDAEGNIDPDNGSIDFLRCSAEALLRFVDGEVLNQEQFQRSVALESGVASRKDLVKKRPPA